MYVPWEILSAAFFQGFLGSLHCFGMCGPFVHIINSKSSNRVLSQLLYNFSRSLSYVLVGVLLGLMGQGLNLLFINQAAAFLGAAVIIVLALGYLLPGNFGHFQLPGRVLGFLGKILGNIKNSYLLAAVMGFSSGFLPCALLYPAYALSLMAGSPWWGGASMLVFSLGTYPALFGFAFASNLLWEKIGRDRYRLVMGLFMLLTGVGMIILRSSGLLTHQDDNCAVP